MSRLAWVAASLLLASSGCSERSTPGPQSPSARMPHAPGGDPPSSPRPTGVKPGVPAKSPSGMHVLRVEERREDAAGKSLSYLHVQVLSPSGGLVYEAPERFAAW